MDTETLIKPQQNVKRSYFIVFDESGKIRKINSTPITKLNDKTLTQIESTNPVCKKLIKGETSIKKYGIIWDILNEKWDIDLRRTKLVLELKHNKLLPFVYGTDITTTEMFVNIFYNDNVAVVQVNKDKIKRIKNLSDITEISTHETELLDIYITRKNDPDYLITVLKLDPLTLFRTGLQKIELDITEHVDWQNISMYTKPVFSNYGWNLLASMAEVPIITNTVLQKSNNKDKNNININVVDNTLYLNSKLTKAQEYYFDGQAVLRVVVCDHTPDNLVGAFEVPVKFLLDNKVSTTTINFKWPKQPLLLYKNNYLTVSTGEIDEQNAEH